MPYAILGAIDQIVLSAGVTCNNPCVILTQDCIIEFMDDFILNGSDTIGTLPEIFRPTEQTIFSALDQNYKNCVIGIGIDGVISVLTGNPQTLLLRGVNVNTCSRWYNNTIGNNRAIGTSPIDEV